MIPQLKTIFLLSSLLFAFSILSFETTAAMEPVKQITIPSRTPTPGSIPPTSPPPPATSTPGNSPPPATTQATSTPVAATKTPIPTTVVVTPIGGVLPTAQPCDTSPTIQTSSTVNVRLGPGTNYTVISQLVFAEVRPIVGRSKYSPWWLIQLADGTQGWVADSTVQVSGYTGNIPLVSAPAINNKTPTPGPAWNPTPVPGCENIPTATAVPATATTTATTAATAIVTRSTAQTATETTVVATASPMAENPNVTSEPTATVSPPALPDATSAAAIAANATEPTNPEETTAIGDNAAGETSNTNTIPVSTTPTLADNLLPIAGGLLIVVGGIGLLTLRRRENA